MQMDVEIGGGTEALDERDRTDVSQRRAPDCEAAAERRQRALSSATVRAWR